MILDGWGYREAREHNAISAANKPNWDRYWREYPHTLIHASGAGVGLPSEQMGNSEVGHLNLGAGRVVYQEFTRICRAIETGQFSENRVLTEAVDQALVSGKALHLLGLLSPGGVHSHENQILAMIELAARRGLKNVYLHAFLDGRDTPPKSAAASLQKAAELFEEHKCGRVASIIGRYYAMDRDHRWPRIKAAYDLITDGKADYSAPDPLTALEMAYKRGESDEFIQATTVCEKDGQPVRIDDGDVIIFMNFRSDRARQITRPFIEPEFDGFARERVPQLGNFVSLTEYNSTFDTPVAFPPERLKNVFGEYISQAGLHQLRIAETEKYAHVTFFFNGGREEPFEGEERILVPSPSVATYDMQPEMNAPELTEKLIEAVRSGRFDTIICNYANPDMVGHTGNFDATMRAIEALDECLGRVVEATQAVGGEIIITADHGNAELMTSNETGQAHTAHTTNLVPLIYIGRPATLADNGNLSDITPTMLELMELAKPDEMSGQSLVSLQQENEPLADTGS